MPQRRRSVIFSIFMIYVLSNSSRCSAAELNERIYLRKDSLFSLPLRVTAKRIHNAFMLEKIRTKKVGVQLIV